LNKSDTLASEHFGSYGYYYQSPATGTMSCARPIRPKSTAESSFPQWHQCLTLGVFLLAGTAGAIPATAQTTEGGPSAGGASSGSGGAGGPGTGGAIGGSPLIPGTAPETLPPPPGAGSGFPTCGAALFGD